MADVSTVLASIELQVTAEFVILSSISVPRVHKAIIIVAMNVMTANLIFFPPEWSSIPLNI